MMAHTAFPARPHRQRGAALITGLVFIVVLTIVGVTASRMASLEERMAGNLRDRSLALQAAEEALRDAERDILGQGANRRNPAISGLTGFDDECNQDGQANTADDGLCDRRGGLPTYTATRVNFPGFSYNAVDYDPASISMTGAPSVVLGRFTVTRQVPLVSAQPRYLIEGFEKQAPGEQIRPVYRITVRAQGANPNTVVWLQSEFRP